MWLQRVLEVRRGCQLESPRRSSVRADSESAFGIVLLGKSCALACGSKGQAYSRGLLKSVPTLLLLLLMSIT